MALAYSFGRRFTPYYVDATGGSDNDDGLTKTTAWQTVAKVNATTFQPDDHILFKRGESFGTTRLVVDDDATPGDRIVIGAYGASADAPVLYSVSMTGDYQTLENIKVDRQRASDTKGVVLLQGLAPILDTVEVCNAEIDGVEIDGADGALIIDPHIHHLLDGVPPDVAIDNHGIRVSNTDGVTITGAINIHHVSGDCIQWDPNWQDSPNPEFSTNIVIEGDGDPDIGFWTSALDSTFSDFWEEGMIPGENGVDTKSHVSFGEPSVFSISNIAVHGFNSGLISNMAAFNMKTNISGTIDRVICYDNEIAFRVRGSSDGGNATLQITNSLIRSGDKAFRIEDSIDDLKVYNCTIASDIVEFVDEAGTGLGSNSDLRNNLFLGTKPAIFSDASNISGDSSYVVNEAAGDYRLVPGTSAVDGGESIGAITVDIDGNTRTGLPDVGAYELVGTHFAPVSTALSMGVPDAVIVTTGPTFLGANSVSKIITINDASSNFGAGTHSYFDMLATSPTFGTPVFNMHLRSSTNIADNVLAAHNANVPPSYDASEDACTWVFNNNVRGTAGLTGGNYANTASGFRPNWTNITSGIILDYYEFKFIGDWLADIIAGPQPWGTGPSDTSNLSRWKLCHIRYNGQSTGIEQRCEFAPPEGPTNNGTNVCNINFRTYGSSPGGTQSSPQQDWTVDNGAITTVFTVHRDVWTRAWRVVDLGTDTMHYWIGDENRAPTKICEIEMDYIAPVGGITFQAITSQDSGGSGSTIVSYAFRNFAVVKDLGSIANATTLVEAGDQT